jgi:transposase InsO family protein
MLGIVGDDQEQSLLIQAKNEAARTNLVKERIAHLNTLTERSVRYKTNAATTSAYEREDIEEIPLDKLEAVPSDLIAGDKGENQLPTAIYGPETLQERLKEVCEEYHDCFSREILTEPARVPPYELHIDESKWEIPAHRLPPRRMDKTRQTELVRQIKVLQDTNTLRVSSAAYYSHPLMVPKPNNKWRFCVDFTSLNKITTWEKWPLPNIQEMLRRIGDKKPKYFIILDLTSGYHQIPIAENCRRWTAFLTFWGIFEWLRMPMGLAGAASYFQKMMTTIVLAGLIMIICEIYLDDLIIPATNEDELIANFITVLQRFRKHKIVINPDKALMGISEAVYVGHTVNEHGLHFKREKLDSVLNFPKPVFSKQLKSFVSLASYFRDHVRNHATRVQPLFELLKSYERNKRIVWTEASEAAFDDIRRAIHECPRLFFMDDVSPIILYTDASDYGIGAYLCQVANGVEVPIAFISCSLIDRMRNWSTPVKEGYAIFYALRKLEYLLRDKFFKIKTDHKNLTLLKDKYGTQDKVQRWFKCYQGFDFEIEDIKGVDNPIADTLSRLCPIETTDETERLCLLEDDALYVPRKEWAIIAKFHNSYIGHHGVERTVSKLQKEGHNWSLMRAHVRRFKKMCPCCQKMDHVGPSIKSHKYTVSSTAPMDTISIDFIEKLKPDEHGNCYLMVIIDAFSRFIELYPAKDNSAKVASLALLQHIGRYGAPYLIKSDRGAAYISRLIKEVTELMGVELAHTMAYCKEENSIVERANKEVERHLRNIIFDKDVLPRWSI